MEEPEHSEEVELPEDAVEDLSADEESEDVVGGKKHLGNVKYND